MDFKLRFGRDRIADRLSLVLTRLHADDPTLFVAQELANVVSRKFGYVLTIAGAAGIV